MLSLAHNDVIPVGAVYTAFNGDVYTEGMKFPEINLNDNYSFGDYEYYYHIDAYQQQIVGWRAISVEDKTKTSYGEILYEINNKDVVCIDNLFSRCREMMSSPKIPQSVKLMRGAFSDCVKLTVPPKIPNSMYDMSMAFMGCSSLKVAPDIPFGVTKLSHTFYGCYSLLDAPAIPSTVIDMKYTFYGCKSLVNAPNIPYGVANMEFAFANCESLTTVLEIPSSVVFFDFIFEGCNKLKTVPNSIQEKCALKDGKKDSAFMRMMKRIIGK